MNIVLLVLLMLLSGAAGMGCNICKHDNIEIIPPPKQESIETIGDVEAMIDQKLDDKRISHPGDQWDSEQTLQQRIDEAIRDGINITL